MGAAAAIIIRKEKEIVRAFRSAGATTAAKSASTSELGVHERMPFRILRWREVIRETTPGRYYLDEAAWARMSKRRKQMLVVAIAFVVLAGAMVYYAGVRAATGR